MFVRIGGKKVGGVEFSQLSPRIIYQVIIPKLIKQVGSVPGGKSNLSRHNKGLKGGLGNGVNL